MLLRIFLLACLLFPLNSSATPCQLLAKLDQVHVTETGHQCNERALVAMANDGTTLSSIQYDEIPAGLERVWVQSCECHVWQITGIGGAHTRIVRFFKESPSGALVEVQGGVFGSEIGRINRSYRNNALYVEVQDASIGARRVTTIHYRLCGDKFVKVKSP